jgi:hypothetical protein
VENVLYLRRTSRSLVRLLALKYVACHEPVLYLMVAQRLQHITNNERNPYLPE